MGAAAPALTRIGDERYPRRVAGLDAVRFVLASWVVFGHFGFFPLTEGVDLAHFEGRIVRAIFNNLCSGPAAVIAFFVVSGFCIHLPNVQVQRVHLGAFYARRNVRIILPAIAAMLASQSVGVDIIDLNDSILWSLICEEIYYLIYPLLLVLRRRVGFRWLIGGAFVVGLAIAASNPDAGNYPSFGWQLNWLLGLPCWLLGCLLAEEFCSRGDVPRTTSAYAMGIWWWRAGVLVLSMICSVLRFHSALTYPWTLNFFAIAVYFWLKRELAPGFIVAPSWVDRCGKASYSIYLFHACAHAIWRGFDAPSLGYGIDWWAKNTFIFGTCFVAYAVIERPSHALARWIGARIGPQRSPQIIRVAPDAVGS